MAGNNAGNNNVQLITRSGTRWARVDNTGSSDAGADLGALIEHYWQAGGADLWLAPGVYLIETPVVVRHSNVSIQG